MKAVAFAWTAAALAVAITAACASSAPGAAGRTSVSGTSDTIWLAAQTAVLDLGGRIVHSNRSVGTLAGRVDLEGRPVRLDVQVQRGPGPDPADGRPVDVSAQASLEGGATPNPELQEELRELVRRYLGLVEARTRPGR